MGENDLKNWLALLGVITGLVGSLSALLASSIAVMTYKREGAVLKIQVRKGWRLINAQPPYSGKKSYTGLTVYNRGRGHANISQVGEVFLIKSGGGIYSDSMIYGTRKLEGETSTDFLVEEGKRKEETVGYYVARTLSGKECRLYPYTRFVFWFFYPSRKIHAFLDKRRTKK